MSPGARGKPIRSIVAATDLSAHGGRVLKRAALLARRLSARFELLHVVDASSLAGAMRALGGRRGARAACIDASVRALDAALAALPPSDAAGAKARVAVGGVREEILRAASRSDLLVLGGRGGGALRGAVLGTTAERLLQKGTRPMLVVKRPAGSAYRHVVVAFDFSADAEAALDMAVRIAAGAPITLVHAYEVEFEGMLRRGMLMQAQIDRLRTRLRGEALTALRRVAARRGGGIQGVVGRGYPARVVLDAAEKRGADLIAVGKRGRSGLERLLIGSLTRHVLGESRCDVLVARR